MILRVLTTCWVLRWVLIACIMYVVHLKSLFLDFTQERYRARNEHTEQQTV